MYHQIVDAHDPLVVQNGLFDILHHFLVGSLPQQRRYRFFHDAEARPVTNAIGAPLASWADVTLLTGRDSHTIYGNAIFSRVADTALVDMLYMGVILSDYGRFSTALDESGRMIRDRVFEN